MTQEATVNKLLSNGYAQVTVARGTACGGNCDNCEACVYQQEVAVVAKNEIEAKVGDRVLIDCKSSKIYGAVMLVYVLPLILMLAGYAVGYALGLTEGWCILSCFAGLLVGAGIVVLQRKNKRMNFTYDLIKIL